MVKSSLWLFSLFLVWADCASAEDYFSDSLFREKIEICEDRGIQKVQDTFCFTGSIPTKSELDQWPELLSSKIFVINSQGGEVEAAMRIARYLSQDDVLTIIHG